MNSKILIADDHRATRQSIRMLLLGEPYDLLEAEDLKSTYETILRDGPDLILLDIHFQEKKTSIDLLRRLAAEQIAIPIIILSGAASAREAAESVKFGAYDYLEKPVEGNRLKLTLQRGLEYGKLRRHLEGATIQSNRQAEIIGKSLAIQKIRRSAERFAAKDVKILITGETGTGKEVIAHFIWQSSGRRHRPFIVVNAAAIPESLMESELFGHKRGAFTGALTDQVGKIEMAHGGTLFLDEVGELSLAAQSKLLRFLETGEIQKVGSGEARQVDVRLVAATSRDLEKELAGNRFRSDLFYRLNVVPLVLPPLRERREDVRLLFAHFVRGFCQKYEEREKLIDQEALEALQAYDWPGNVRELRNVAEKLVVASPHRILADQVREILPARRAPTEAPLPLREFKAAAEREHILRVLRTTDGSVTEAARLLEIDRAYLHQKMTQLGIQRGEALED